MKNNFFALIMIAIVASSCSYQVYTPSVLNMNMESRMSSQTELAAMANVSIYLNDSEIPANSEVIALCSYAPAIVVPIIAPASRQYNRKYFQKAVLKAYELGGTGIVVSTPGSFKVIRTQGLERIAVANPILSMEGVNAFSQSIAAATKNSHRKKAVKALCEEIETNLKDIETAEELEAVTRKIDTVDDYNLSQKKADKGLSDDIKKYRRTCRAKARKLSGTSLLTEKKAQVTEKFNQKKDELKAKLDSRKPAETEEDE